MHDVCKHSKPLMPSGFAGGSRRAMTDRRDMAVGRLFSVGAASAAMLWSGHIEEHRD